ncbi:hypothetical protein [Desulfobacula sp.]|uniref:hypothetical protein n=1 Tax=Desulfobacula sp. TaxID=2593537 RepID=UPI002606A5E7|nr:hypothetical protein [Desulfobacula sp.]
MEHKEMFINWLTEKEFDYENEVVKIKKSGGLLFDSEGLKRIYILNNGKKIWCKIAASNFEILL